MVRPGRGVEPKTLLSHGVGKLNLMMPSSRY